MNLDLLHAGRYTHEQCSTQVTNGCFLGLWVSGIEYSRSFDPQGKLYIDRRNATLSLIPPGFKCEYSFNSDRENFVLVCDIPGLQYQPDEEQLFLRHKDDTIRLHRAIPLSKEKLFFLRQSFERIVELKRSSLPGNIFMAEQLCSAVLAELAISEEHEMQNGSISEQLAMELKKHLDADECFSSTLQEHCRILGYSPEHARRCFYNKYNIDPREYRLRRRLEKIMHLLTENRMSAKEIAAEVGMRNVTHLHAFVRQRCDMTLSQLICKLPR